MNANDSPLLELEKDHGAMLDVGRWTLPEDKVLSYLKLIRATENGKQDYNYAYDKRREAMHSELMELAGVQIHDVREYRGFTQALRELCDEMLPLPDDTPAPSKLVVPRMRG